MKKTFHPDLCKASICLGLQKGYSKTEIHQEDVISYLQLLQNELIKEKQIHLSANCFLSNIILSGQKEPHLNLQFFNYPKFSLPEENFKTSVEWIAERLMEAFDQNRIVVQFHDGNLMLEKNDAIDPSIMIN
ncbi:MAG: hypothetical protein ACR2KB_00785 [Chitinophagaceae bacterium]